MLPLVNNIFLLKKVRGLSKAIDCAWYEFNNSSKYATRAFKSPLTDVSLFKSEFKEFCDDISGNGGTSFIFCWFLFFVKFFFPAQLVQMKSDKKITKICLVLSFKIISLSFCLQLTKLAHL